MYFNKIPPIKGEDHKENFIQNFFSRLMDMRISRESEVFQIFLNDEKMKKVSKAEIKGIENTVISLAV